MKNRVIYKIVLENNKNDCLPDENDIERVIEGAYLTGVIDYYTRLIKVKELKR